MDSAERPMSTVTGQMRYLYMGYSGLGKQTFYPSMPKCRTGTFLAYKNTILAQITVKLEKSIFYLLTSKCLIIDLICITLLTPNMQLKCVFKRKQIY